MPFPLIAKIGLGAGIAWFLSRGKDANAAPAPAAAPVVVQTPNGPVVVPVVPSPTHVPVAQRMATVLATGNPAAIRFEAGRLRQEGYGSQATELEREAARLEAAAVASAPQVGPLPSGTVTSPGFVPPVAVPVPTPAVPVTVQTPAGPVTVNVPAAAMPQQPAPVLPSLPVTVQTPAGPVTVPSLPSIPVVPLPQLAKGEILDSVNPGQTYSEKTKLWQGKLASIGLLAPADVIGKYGPKTVAGTKQFQGLANAYLKLVPGGVVLPTTGARVSSIKVDGRLGEQTLGMAMLAHPPKGTGATATYFGSLDAGLPEPLPASPLPGVIPPMAPRPIEPQMALASRVAHNLTTTPAGAEDRQLVQLLQAQHGLRCTGLYNASTALLLGERFGIIPPAPRYWTDSRRGKSKANYRAALRALGKKDPQRAEEWEQAAAAV